MATTISDKPNIFIRRPILSMVISIVITPGWSAGDLALPIAQYPGTCAANGQCFGILSRRERGNNRLHGHGPSRDQHQRR